MTTMQKKYPLLKITTFLFISTLLCVGCTSMTPVESVTIYKIGDTGPANGIIFFDKGDYSDGYRYLEVAPVETERSLQWGAFNTPSGASSASLGDGKSNTTTIIASHRSVDEREYAAKYCENLEINGFSDWYLPSKVELDLLYWQISGLGIGDFQGIGFGYWSSTEYDETQAWGQGFHEGIQGRIEKTEQFLVRAIRSF